MPQMVPHAYKMFKMMIKKLKLHSRVELSKLSKKLSR